MLDDLLGRSALRDRIDELEESNHHLERRLEAERERAASAKRDRQRAEERNNRLEDRIADLEGRLDDGKGDRATGGRARSEEPTYRYRESLRGDRLDAVLDRLASFEAGPEGALTAMVTSGVPDPLRELLGERAALVGRAAPTLVCADDAGSVALALDAPLAPAPFERWSGGFELDREWFQPTGEFTLALVRSDLFALGEYDGRKRVSFEGFESDVMGEHSKGGFSQGRFERRRDNQIEAHLDRCRSVIENHGSDRFYLTGQHTLLDEFDATATAAVDATGDPEDALETAFRTFFTTRLYGL